MALSEAGFVPKPSLGPRANNVIIPLDLTQLSCPGFMLAAGLSSGFTTDRVGCWGGEPCGEPAISLHSHHVSLVHEPPVCFPSQGTQVQIPRGYLCETGIHSCLVCFTALIERGNCYAHSSLKYNELLPPCRNENLPYHKHVKQQGGHPLGVPWRPPNHTRQKHSGQCP